MKTKLFLTITIFTTAVLLSAQNPIIIPGTLSGTAFELNLQNGTFQFYDGINTTTMGVNGDMLGPTLIMQKGDDVDITVNNNLDETTTIHWHGMHVSAENDGGPHTTIAPGASWNPQFTVLDKAGTYWYHPHLHEKTNEHVSKGIAGFIIVQDEEAAALDLPRTYGVDDFPLVIQTKDFDAQKEIIVPSNSDDVLLVNATIDPYLAVPAQVIRFRLLNGSSMRVFNFGLSDNSAFYMIGSDGGLLSEPLSLTRLQMSPGERAEILIDFGGKEGQQLKMMSYAAEFNNGIYGATYPGMGQMMTLDGYNPNAMNGTNFEVITFNIVAPNSDPVTTIPTALVDVTPIPESESDITRNLNFTPEVSGPDQLNGNFFINGTTFDMDVINYSIPLNNTEIWSITNQSGIAHPFHIHDVQFYVLDRNGNPPPASEQGRKDVVLIKPQETVRFITKFEDFANDPVPYMFHCHMLIHEDGGMMLQFEVVDLTIGIEDNEPGADGFVLFPNPVTDDYLTLKSGSEEASLTSYELYSLTGKMMMQGTVADKTAEIKINVSGISEGLYFLKAFSGQTAFTQKIVIQ
ncbi:MAG: multicopper oxidase domain-containing protein [Bacteroidales bacterium]|nr:multicopper oxidase domain-containing protein [Bacteroidales bacterium]